MAEFGGTLSYFILSIVAESLIMMLSQILYRDMSE
jgi:hypothetical protein